MGLDVFRLRNLVLATASLLAVAPALAQAPAGSFLVISDVHYGETADPSSPNDPKTQTCGVGGPETGPILWSAAQDAAQTLIAAEKPTFLIYLGDLPSHCPQGSFGPGGLEGDFTIALNGLANIAGQKSKLIYVPGNNDSLDGDYMAFTTAKGTPLDKSPAWAGKPVLNAQAGDMVDSSHLAKGFYSVYGEQKTNGASALRVIVLNTNIFTQKYNSNVADYQADTNTQLEWLNAQLKDVAAKGERAIIAMHAPPGTDGFGGRKPTLIKTMWNENLKYTGTDKDLTQGWVQQTFLQIVANYQPEIVGLLSSHTHINDIRRLRDCSQKLPLLGKFTELVVGVPAVTTDHGNMPSFKLVSYDTGYEWTNAKGNYATDDQGNGWKTNQLLMFAGQNNSPLVNYPCPSCSSGMSLKDQIGTIDSATKINTSDQLAGYMRNWLKMIPGTPTGPRQYKLSLDVTCEVPNRANIR